MSAHARALEVLRERDRLRELTGRSGHDFSSNDYLGLAGSPQLAQAAVDAVRRGVPMGATGSRLLRGNHSEHEELEAEAAKAFGSDGALYFASGFMANYALFSTLPMGDDLVVYDELIHASVHDGLRAGRSQTLSAKHNHVQSFADVIGSWRKSGGTGRVWVAVESVYSMDGDRAPLDDLFKIANVHDAFLVVDEAHATGVWGQKGCGLAAHLEGRENVITVHTCGKALGVMGGIVCASRPMIDFLVNRARAFIYATAPSPLVASVVRAALTNALQDDARRERLHDLVEYTGGLLREMCDVVVSGSQIQPVIIGSDSKALAVAAAMRASGFDIRAIRPPTVPRGTSRLRVSLTLNVTKDDVAAMVKALGHELRRAAT